MKLIRTLSIAFTLLVPVAAIASPAVRAPVCCTSGHCCPGCPLCPHA
jgi:hypothetical protein